MGMGKNIHCVNPAEQVLNNYYIYVEKSRDHPGFDLGHSPTPGFRPVLYHSRSTQPGNRLLRQPQHLAQHSLAMLAQ